MERSKSHVKRKFCCNVSFRSPCLPGTWSPSSTTARGSKSWLRSSSPGGGKLDLKIRWAVDQCCSLTGEHWGIFDRLQDGQLYVWLARFSKKIQWVIKVRQPRGSVRMSHPAASAKIAYHYSLVCELYSNYGTMGPGILAEQRLSTSPRPNTT